MSEAKHTPEPWAFSPERHTHDCFIHQEGAVPRNGYISPEDGGVVGSSEWTWLKDEDARRIVACVNACAGIADPEALRRERDEAVEVLREIAAMDGLTICGPRHDEERLHEEGAAKAFSQAAEAARAFLAKTKGAP